jgi:hypothetical protein
MKINLPKASTLVVKAKRKIKTREVNMRKVVIDFLNGIVFNEINTITNESPTTTGLNIAVPNEAYANLVEFYVIASHELTKLGYTSAKSHDGGGMYDTLWISWK